MAGRSYLKFKITDTRHAKSNVRRYFVDWDTPVIRGRNWGQRQFEVKQFLRKYWEDHIVLEEFIIPRSGKKSLDFLNLTLGQAIEVDGEHHFCYSEFWHKGKILNYYNQKLRDVEKERFCELNQIDLIRIFPADPIDYNFFRSKGIIL